jgi:hypothetical protein
MYLITREKEDNIKIDVDICTVNVNWNELSTDVPMTEADVRTVESWD